MSTIFKTEYFGPTNPLTFSVDLIQDRGDFKELAKNNRELASELNQHLEKALNTVRKILYKDEKKRQYTIDSLTALFENNWFARTPIPNQYWGPDDPYSYNSPWLEVNTFAGTFVIGWRKRVINIDFSGTWCNKSANDLFPAEDVTKSHKLIHAWSEEKAKEYISKIMVEIHKQNER